MLVGLRMFFLLALFAGCQAQVMWIESMASHDGLESCTTVCSKNGRKCSEQAWSQDEQLKALRPHGCSEEYSMTRSDVPWYRSGRCYYGGGFECDSTITKTDQSQFWSTDNAHRVCPCEVATTTTTTTTTTQVVTPLLQFTYVESAMSWTDARKHCQDVFGGDLAEPRDVVSNEAVFKTGEAKDRWVGGQYRDGAWRWLDSAASFWKCADKSDSAVCSTDAFANWRMPGRGSTEVNPAGAGCLRMNWGSGPDGQLKGEWESKTCSKAQPFICSAPRQGVTQVIAASATESPTDKVEPCGGCEDELGKLRVTHAEAEKKWEAEVEKALDADKIKFVKLTSAQADASNCQDELGRLRVTHTEAAKRWEAEVEKALDTIKFVKLTSAQADASNCQDELGKLRVTHAEAANKCQAEVEKAREAEHKASKAAMEEELQKAKADLQTVKDEMQKMKDEKLFSAVKEKEELSGKLIKADEQIAQVQEQMQKMRDGAKEQDLEIWGEILRNAVKEKEDLAGKLIKVEEGFNKDCATFESDATCPGLPRCSWTGTACEVPGLWGRILDAVLRVNPLDIFDAVLRGWAAMTVFGICVAFVVMAFLTGAGGGGAINYLRWAGAIAILFLAMFLASKDDVGKALVSLAEQAQHFLGLFLGIAPTPAPA